MAEKNLGKIAITIGGHYDPSISYGKLVMVYYEGNSWISKTDVPAGMRPSDVSSSYWQISALKGEPTKVVNNLVDGGEQDALSAEQGKVLNEELAQLSQEWQGLQDSIQDAVLKVEVAPHIEVVTIQGGAAILQPDKLYDFGEVATLAVGFEPPLEGKAANYAFQFKSPADAPTTITMPDSVVFPVESDSMFNVKAGRTYQVTILNGLASASSWEV